MSINNNNIPLDEQQQLELVMRHSLEVAKELESGGGIQFKKDYDIQLRILGVKLDAESIVAALRKVKNMRHRLRKIFFFDVLYTTYFGGLKKVPRRLRQTFQCGEYASIPQIQTCLCHALKKKEKARGIIFTFLSSYYKDTLEGGWKIILKEELSKDIPFLYRLSLCQPNIIGHIYRFLKNLRFIMKLR